MIIFQCFNQFDQGYFAGSIDKVFELIGMRVDGPTLNIILPVGISFYTFQTLSYTIDIYRKRMEPTRSFIDFALYVSFFPQLVAGSIERARRLLPQISGRRTVTAEMFASGCCLMLIG